MEISLEEMRFRYENEISVVLFNNIEKIRRYSSKAFAVPCNTGEQFRWKFFMKSMRFLMN